MGEDAHSVSEGDGGGASAVLDDEDARMKNRLVFTVGNEMMGDDAAGPLLARKLEESPLDGWDVIDGGSSPENYVFKIRDLAPSEVLIVDSADMELEPGDVRHIDQDAIGALFLMTTHSLPLNYL